MSNMRKRCCFAKSATHRTHSTTQHSTAYTSPVWTDSYHVLETMLSWGHYHASQKLCTSPVRLPSPCISSRISGLCASPQNVPPLCIPSPVLYSPRAVYLVFHFASFVLSPRLLAGVPCHQQWRVQSRLLHLTGGIRRSCGGNARPAGGTGQAAGRNTVPARRQVRWLDRQCGSWVQTVFLCVCGGGAGCV